MMPTIDLPRTAMRINVEFLEQRILYSATLVSSPVYTIAPTLFPCVPAKPAYTDNGFEDRSSVAIAQHRKLFSGVFGSFVDVRDSGAASDYQASIQFNDGTSIPAQVIASEDGKFNVVGQRTMVWGSYSFDITIRDLRQADRTTTLSNSITVHAPPTVGQPVDITATSGQKCNDLLLARYVGLDLSMLDRYRATISWGDGASNATIVDLGDGVAGVYGSHTYAKPGSFDLKVTLTEEDGAGGSCTTYAHAEVAAGAVVGDAVDLTLTAGEPFHGTIATFLLTDPSDEVSRYRATIERDGVESDATIEATTPGTFRVVADITDYTVARSTYSVNIYNRESGSQVAIEHGSIDTRLGWAVGNYGITATAGSEFSGAVAAFGTPDPSGQWTSTFEATVDWGDGFTSAGTMVQTWGNSWAVFGAHTYASSHVATYHSLTVRITEHRQYTAAGSPADPVTYQVNEYGWANIAPDLAKAFELRSAYGAEATLGHTSVVATLSYYTGDPADITGSITWEDGVTSGIELHGSGDSYSVWSDRVFTEAGAYRGKVTITSGDRTVECETYVPVRRPLGWVSPHQLNAVAGHEWYGEIAVLDPAPGITVDQLSASISWGDASSSVPATLALAADGTIRISGAHTFDQPGDRGVFISVSVKGGRIDCIASVTIAKDPAFVYAQGRYANFRQREAFTTSVATFTVPQGFDGLQCQVSIDWGDGTTSQGVVTHPYGGVYEVNGSHRYQTAGHQDVTVTIIGPANTATAKSSIWLEADPVVIKPDVDVVTDQLWLGGQLATFINETPGTTSERAYHAAMVDWGDGEISQGSITDRGDGTFQVNGDHEYETSGEYKVTLIVRQTRRRTMIRNQFLTIQCCGTLDAATVAADEEQLFTLVLFTARVSGSKRPIDPLIAPEPTTPQPQPQPQRIGQMITLPAFSNQPLPHSDILFTDPPILGASPTMLQ